jgi:hypothetical protein
MWRMSGETLFYIRSDSLGVDSEIGTRLSQAFLNSLHETLTSPVTLAFANRGVFLTLDDSPVLGGLRRLVDLGCPVYSCGSCLDFYQVRDRLAVGEIGSIPVLQELMLNARKVITV